MKITTKTTKKELAEVLALNAPLVQKKDKSLAEQIAYAIQMFGKNEAKVTKKDLNDLVKSATTLLGKKFITPVLAEEKVEEPKTAKKPIAKKETSENSVKKEETVAENSTKILKKDSKTKKKVSAKAEEPTKKETTEAPATEEKSKKIKKDSKKSAPKAKKESVATVYNKEEEPIPQAVLLAEVFKDEIEVDGDKYTIAHDIDSIGKLRDSLEADETIVFAMYWTKRHLKQFPYFNGDFKAPKEFPLDLDLATCVYVSDEGVVAYAISMYSEGCYVFPPHAFEETQGLRFSNGIEFQIYRLVE